MAPGYRSRDALKVSIPARFTFTQSVVFSLNEAVMQTIALYKLHVSSKRLHNVGTSANCTRISCT